MSAVCVTMPDQWRIIRTPASRGKRRTNLLAMSLAPASVVLMLALGLGAVRLGATDELASGRLVTVAHDGGRAECRAQEGLQGFGDHRLEAERLDGNLEAGQGGDLACLPAGGVDYYLGGGSSPGR